MTSLDCPSGRRRRCTQSRAGRPVSASDRQKNSAGARPSARTPPRRSSLADGDAARIIIEDSARLSRPCRRCAARAPRRRACVARGRGLSRYRPRPSRAKRGSRPVSVSREGSGAAASSARASPPLISTRRFGIGMRARTTTPLPRQTRPSALDDQARLQRANSPP